MKVDLVPDEKRGPVKAAFRNLDDQLPPVDGLYTSGRLCEGLANFHSEERTKYFSKGYRNRLTLCIILGCSNVG